MVSEHLACGYIFIISSQFLTEKSPVDDHVFLSPFPVNSDPVPGSDRGVSQQGFLSDGLRETVIVCCQAGLRVTQANKKPGGAATLHGHHSNCVSSHPTWLRHGLFKMHVAFKMEQLFI